MRQYDSIRQKSSFGRCTDFVEVGKRRARTGGERREDRYGAARPLAQSAWRTTTSIRGLRRNRRVSRPPATALDFHAALCAFV